MSGFTAHLATEAPFFIVLTFGNSIAIINFIMKVGFTGTREGMTNAQAWKCEDIFQHIGYVSPFEEFHHGDCIGADARAHSIIILGSFARIIVCHPPTYEKYRAFTVNDEYRTPEGYIDRNHKIVDETDVLVATPKEETGETLRSGTWATVRYARKLKKRIIIIRPSGTVEFEN